MGLFYMKKTAGEADEVENAEGVWGQAEKEQECLFESKETNSIVTRKG